MNEFSSKSLVLFVLQLAAASAEEGCTLNVQNNLHSKSPMLLNTTFQIIVPQRDGNILLKKGEQIALACPGDTNFFKIPQLAQNIKHIEVSCIRETTFNLEGEINMQNISCNKVPESVPRVIINKCNGKDNTLAEIGFEIGKIDYLKMIDICFDKARCRPVYTKHTLFPGINARQVSSGTTFRNVETFLFDNLGDRPANLFPCKTQKETLLKLLGSDDIVNKYISCTDSTNQLVKGHLSPNADFIFSYQQNATYYHSNAAPQWQFFNNRNWKALEERIRSHVQASDHEYYVFTGTSEEATILPDNNNNIADIYLSPNNKLPAPLYYWKLIQDSETKSGIGFIGYNVHFNQSPPFFKVPDYESICVDTQWFKESEITIEKGLIFCMEVTNLLNIVGFKDFIDEVEAVTEFKSKNILRTTDIRYESGNFASNQILEYGLKIVFVIFLIVY